MVRNVLADAMREKNVLAAEVVNAAVRKEKSVLAETTANAVAKKEKDVPAEKAVIVVVFLNFYPLCWLPEV